MSSGIMMLNSSYFAYTFVTFFLYIALPIMLVMSLIVQKALTRLFPSLKAMPHRLRFIASTVPYLLGIVLMIGIAVGEAGFIRFVDAPYVVFGFAAIFCIGIPYAILEISPIFMKADFLYKFIFITTIGLGMLFFHPKFVEKNDYHPVGSNIAHTVCSCIGIPSTVQSLDRSLNICYGIPFACSVIINPKY